MDLLSDVSLEPIEAKNVAALDGMTKQLRGLA